MIYGNYPDLKKVKKVLVIKLRHHGDVLLTSPVFKVLKTALPQAEIDAYLYLDTLPMLEGHPAIRRFHLYNRAWKKKSFLGRLLAEMQLLKEIRKERYDLVMNLTEGDRGAMAAFISGAEICVGFDPGKEGMMGKRKFFSHLVGSCPTPRHTVEKQLDALRKIGIFPAWEERELFFAIPEQERKCVFKTNYIVIHPVSRWMFKCPPVSFTAELVRRLQEKGETVVISSGPDIIEKAYCQDVLQRVPKERVLDYSGKMTLKGLGALIEGAEALITVDSVPVHLASALKTPVVALFGPTSEVHWGPWRHPLAKVVTQSFPCRPCFKDGCGGSKVSDCLHSLEVSKVLEAFYSLKSSPKYEERASLLRNNSSTVPDNSTFPSLMR
ncbi:MAG: putative lipopolysaccharide heptosyltransferase III [Simkania sp.]|nr:putative lipopolysaccharide heptosyltransferase III [Simkania sp.]